MKKTNRILFVFLVALLLTALLSLGAQALGETSVTISDYVLYSGGKATVSWTVSGDAPSYYMVFAMVNNGSGCQQAMVDLGMAFDTSITTGSMVPGFTYDVYVTDKDYNILGTGTCSVPDVPAFEDGRLKDTSIKISTENRRYTIANQKIEKVKKLSAKEISGGMDNLSALYGVRYQMKMPQLAKPRSFFVTQVFEAPNGFLYVEHAEDVTFERVNNGYQTLWWNISGPDFFGNLYDKNGMIPVGTYKIHLFWDGMRVNTTSFEVGN